MSFAPVWLDLNGFLRVLKSGMKILDLLVGVGSVAETEVIVRS